MSRNVVVFLNSLDADENFFHDSLADKNSTPVCKSFSNEQVKESNNDSKNNEMILNINVRNFNSNFHEFRILFRNQQD